jgi:hypothetical protein
MIRQATEHPAKAGAAKLRVLAALRDAARCFLPDATKDPRPQPPSRRGASLRSPGIAARTGLRYTKLRASG